MNGENLTLLLLLQGVDQLAHVDVFWLNSYKSVKRTFKKKNFIRGLAAVSRNCLYFKQQIFGKISDKHGPKRATENHLPRDLF